MVKRRRTKASTAAKTKANDKEKTVKPSNTEETSSPTSPSSIKKKPKLDSSQSPSAKKSKKYVPPFTASQRASSRLRNNRINSEKNEGKSNSQEAKYLEGERKDVSKSEQEKGNSQEGQEETSAIVLESNEEKTDKVPPNTSIDIEQSDVEMEIENVEGKDPEAEKEETIASENKSACLSSEKQSSVDNQIESDESSTNHGPAKDENTVTPPEIGKKVNEKIIQQVPKLSNLAQQSYDLLERSGGIREEMGMVKNAIGGSVGSSNESETSKLEESTIIVDAQMSGATGLQTNKLDTNTTTVGARLCDFDAGLHTLADTCAGEEYIIDVVSVTEETDQSESSQNQLQNTTDKEMNGLSRKRKAVENKNNSQDSDETNAILVQYEDVKTDVIICSSSKLKTAFTTLAEHRTTENLVNRKNPSSNEIDDKNAVNFTIQAINEPMNKSSSPEPKLQDTVTPLSQELIKDKLSEMLSIVSENEMNGLSLSQTKSESNTNESPWTENNDKSLDDPANEGFAVTHTEMMSSERDKHKSGTSQDKRMEEGDTSNMYTGNNNSQNATTTEHIEVDNNNDPVKNEKVEDENNQLSARVNRDKNSQNATTAEKVEDASKQLSSRVSKTSEVEDAIGERMELASNKQVFHENSNDQEVPVKVVSSPDQKVPDTMATSPTPCKEKDILDVYKNKNTAETYTKVATAILNSSEHPTTDVSHNDSKKVRTTEKEVDVTTSSNIVDDQSFAKEFEALEELLPRDDIGLFDDVIMSQPKSISLSVDNELADGDSTIEFLINELKSLHCMVASHERAVEDMKRQYKFGRF